MFNHDEVDPKIIADNFRRFQDILDKTDIVVGHNLKFDMSWLFEAGFKYTGKYFDTMIFEYIRAMGIKTPFSLAETLKRYDLEPKLDILQEYCGKRSLNVNQIPLNLLIEYGTQDVEVTYQLYLRQKQYLKSNTIMASQIEPLKLMNEFLVVLIDVERNGIKIDKESLDNVEEEFKAKYKELEAKLTAILQQVMGHTPINLNSPEHMSQVIYSLKVKDKASWSLLFNLSGDYPKRYKPWAFEKLLKSETNTVYKTKARQCPHCEGKGYIQLYCKDGTPRKRLNVCHSCEKSGILYDVLDEVAGFKITPISSEYASAGGFSTSKDVLEELILTDISKEAKEFLKLLIEYNAVSTYLSSFVEGIRKNVEDNWILHTTFNQCVTSTGRLSSTRPNLQNQPRESTFPIRKVFVSRFKNGKLLNADYAQLEFRVAAFNAQCANAISDIKNKVDVHTQTMNALIEGGEEINRQDSKKFTFRPLFGGTSGTKAQKHYFEYFFSRYTGIFDWHKRLIEEALKYKYIRSPSGRCYAFPFVAQRENGSVSYATQIKNYEVQGFATGDILPITMIIIHNLMIKQNVKSKLVLTVHDSIVADCHPDEIEIMIDIFKQGFTLTKQSIKQRFNVDFNVPLEFDLDIGDNLLNKTKIK